MIGQNKWFVPPPDWSIHNILEHFLIFDFWMTINDYGNDNEYGNRVYFFFWDNPKWNKHAHFFNFSNRNMSTGP